MRASERHLRHAAWCEAMAAECRADAERARIDLLSETGAAAYQRYMNLADRYLDEAVWYREHSKVMQ